MRILTLFARNGNKKYPDEDLRVIRHLEEKLGSCHRDFLIIDTSIDSGIMTKRSDGITILGSSNEQWEFGAWRTGLSFYSDKLYEYDYIHFTTSALYNGYVDFHGFLSREMLELYRDRAVALGHIEVYNDSVAFRSVRFQAWLRSSYIFVPSAEVAILQDPVSVQGPDGIFSGNPAEPFLQGGVVSPRYAFYLNSWLTGEGTGQGVQWHSRFNLDNNSLPFFHAKALAIINEMSLSNRLKAQGCSLIDMTWLHRKISSCSVPSYVPHWHRQLFERGTGHESIVEEAR